MNTPRNIRHTTYSRPSVAQKRTTARPSAVPQAPTATPLGGGGGTGAGPGGMGNSDNAGQQTLMSRRKFLYGALGVGAVAAVGAGAFAYNAAVNGESEDISYLNAPASALTTLNDFQALDNAEGSVQQVGEYDLPYGTLVWANDESVAACLLPTETGSPLTHVGLLSLGSGLSTTVLERAVGSADGFEIYDVRANSQGIVWTEANILQGAWRVYSATVSGGSTIGAPQLMEEGDDAYETPTLAVAGSRAFWQVNPKQVDSGEMPNARLMGGSFGKDDGTAMLESSRRMSSPPYAYENTITVAPRVDSASAYYQLTNLDASSGSVLDTLTLPHAIKPIESGYGKTGFMFSFPDIYDYKGAIANLGTYTPLEKPSGGDYNGARWFDFARTPTAAPAWCKDLLIVKSTYTVCGVDLNKGTYFALDVENGADNYGEYLASTGNNDTFVTYTNIDHTPVGAGRVYTCRVKVWSPLA